MVRASSRVERLIAALQPAQDAGLRAAAYVYRNAVVAKLIKGYTTGAFVTGTSANSVTITEPFASDNGGRAIRVGTNVLYDLYWELGHENLFTRKYERVEYWGPSLAETADEQRSAFIASARPILEAALA